MKLRNATIILTPLTGDMIYDHCGTSYRLSRNKEMTDIFSNVVKSIEHKNQYTFTVPVGYDKIYVTVKRHYESIPDEDTVWSTPTPVLKCQNKITYSDTIIQTPDVSVNLVKDNIFVTFSNFLLIRGIGKHESTTIDVKNTDNITIYTVNNIPKELTEFNIPIDVIENNKLYTVEVTHITDVGTNSNPGKDTIHIETGKVSRYRLDTPYPLVNERLWFHHLRIFNIGYKSVKLRLLDKLNNIIVEQLYISDLTPTIPPLSLIVGDVYTLECNVNMNNIELGWKTVDVFKCIENELTKDDMVTSYHGKYEYKQLIDTFGGTVQHTSQIYTGDILMMKHNDNKIYRYRLVDNIVKEAGIVYTIPNSLLGTTKIMSTILIRYDGMVTLDIGDRNTNIPRFLHLIYNPISKKLILDTITPRENELGTTAMCNSLVLMENNIMYHIPYRMKNGGNLVLIKTNLSTNVTRVTPLPFNCTSDVTISKLGKNKLIITGGVSHLDNEYLRVNNNIYIIDTNRLDSLEPGDPEPYNKIGTMTTKQSVYNYQSVTTSSGDVIIFNGCNQGDGIYDDTHYLVKPNDSVQMATVEEVHIALNTGSPVGVRSTIKLLNGTILRTTDSPNGLNIIYDYSVVNATKGDLNLTPGSNDISTTLMVPIGKTIMLTDLHRYNRIVIEGDSDTNTGKLQLLNNLGEISNYHYNDMIITKSGKTVIGDRIWNSITVIDNLGVVTINQPLSTTKLVTWKGTTVEFITENE